MRLLAIVIGLGFALNAQIIAAKPFKRVLVISGGGLNPGASIGLIAGVQEMGWKPDLIIATCGAAIGATIYNSEQSIAGSYDVLRSWDVFQAMNQVKIETANGISIIQKLNGAKNVSRYPDLFTGNLLFVPEELPRFLKKPEFNRDPALTKLIILSARALFFPHQVGDKRAQEPMFQQVYFTDPETGELLKGRTLSRPFSYPYTTLTPETLTITHKDALAATRAGIADPYLLNPNIIDGYYHFTGAVDLFPLDLAVELGDEVVATFPSALFLDYEKSAVNSAFGFDQSTRALQAIQHKDVKWIDISGTDSFSFNPSRMLVIMRSEVPSNFREFKLKVAQQWNFGRERAAEAIRVAPGKKTDVRWHLRNPINPKLLDDFSCRNAYEWKTEWRDSCISDRSSSCNRTKAKKCVPIR